MAIVNIDNGDGTTTFGFTWTKDEAVVLTHAAAAALDRYNHLPDDDPLKATPFASLTPGQKAGILNKAVFGMLFAWAKNGIHSQEVAQALADTDARVLTELFDNS